MNLIGHNKWCLIICVWIDSDDQACVYMYSVCVCARLSYINYCLIFISIDKVIKLH